MWAASGRGLRASGGGASRARWVGLTGGARYKVGHAAVARACGDRVRGEVTPGEFSRGWPRRLPLCGAALRPGKRVSRDIHGLVTGVPVACTGSRALLGAAGALGLEPGCPPEGADAGPFGTMPFARFMELGMPGRAFLCLALVGLRHFCCSRRGSCPPSSRF